MRVLFVTQWFDPEPGAIRGLPLARSLRAAGDEVEVVTGFPNYPGGRLYPGYAMSAWRRQVMDGVSVLRVPLYPSHDGSAAGRILNYASFALSASILGSALSGPADVGYVYHPPPTVGLAACVMKLLRRTPFVYHIADMWPESVIESGMIRNPRARAIAERVISLWCDFVYRQASIITVLSPGFKKLLQARGVPESKIRVVYNWTDEDVFRPVAKDPQLAAELGVAGTFNILYAGNLGTFQGVDIMIRAAALLEDLPDTRLIIAGTGQKEGELRELAANLGTPNVVFLGRREYWEMPKVYALADVQLVHLKDLPFFNATIPSKTQVSMAVGKPTVMAVRGDAAWLIEQSGAGVVADPDDPSAMADAIRKIYRLSPHERAAMGQRGREYYLREMSLANGTLKMREIFRSAAERTA